MTRTNLQIKVLKEGEETQVASIENTNKTIQENFPKPPPPTNKLTKEQEACRIANGVGQIRNSK